MSKINQIQQKLKAIDQGTFQKLCDSYLHKEGYRNLWSLGSAAGANKTKPGRPDTLVSQPDGKYVLVEYTTHQTGLAKKLHSDLDGCFLDSEKTGIKREQIERVILCFNSDIDAELQNELVSKAQDNGYLLSLYGMTKISFALFQDYQYLAQEFLNVSIDTGQILDAEDFVRQYGKNALTTPLDTTFCFRQEELQKTLDSLEQENLILLVGPAGVGKTRLALEACARYKEKHPDTEVRCILSRQLDLFQDLRDHFSGKEDYLIVVDDANRTSRFNYFRHLLHEERRPGRIKIIATVRDYARPKIQQDLDEYGTYQTIELKPFLQKEILDFVREVFEIKDRLYLTRIAQLSKGNPRLAAMMARLALQKKTFESIVDISSLYDTYFDSIRMEVDGLDDENILKAAGLISFYRAINASNDNQMDQIRQHFSLSEEQLWEGIHALHDLEAVDLYEDQIAKVVDQSLATYLFYVVFFRERLLDISPLLINLYPATDSRLRDAIYPCLDAFDFELIVGVLRPIFQLATQELQGREDGEKRRLEFLTTFWFVASTETLLHAQSVVEAIKSAEGEETQSCIDAISFEPAKNTSNTPIVQLLAQFSGSSSADRKMALEMLLDILQSTPESTPVFLSILFRHFGFELNSAAYGCETQHDLVDALWQRSEEGSSLLFSRILICIAERFLRTEHETTRSENRRSLTLTWFQLPASELVLTLRAKLWQYLFTFWGQAPLTQYVRAAIQAHSSSGKLASQKEIIETDAPTVLSGLSERLDPERYEDCALIQSYLSLLHSNEIEVDAELEERFKDRTYRLSELLIPDRRARREQGREAYEALKQTEIKKTFSPYSREDYQSFFVDAARILQSQASKGHISWEIIENVLSILTWLRKHDTDLFIVVLEDYLDAGNTLQLEKQGASSIIRHLIDIVGIKRAHEILFDRSFPGQARWQFQYCEALKHDEVEPEDSQELIQWYDDTPAESYLYLRSELLTKHLQHDPHIACSIVARMLEHCKNGYPQAAWGLRGIFDFRDDTGVGLSELFAGDTELLKRAYFAALSAHRSMDHRGESFDQILDRDPEFGAEYVRWAYDYEEYPDQHDDSRDYSFLWNRRDTESIVRSMLRTVLDLDRPALFGEFASVFFVRSDNKTIGQDEGCRQMQFLQEEITAVSDDDSYMRLLFKIGSLFSAEERHQLVQTFVQYNQDFEVFTGLALEPYTFGWVGSRVPTLQVSINFYKSLIPIFSSVSLLRHRQLIEQRIHRLQAEVKRSMEDDFLDDVR